MTVEELIGHLSMLPLDLPVVVEIPNKDSWGVETYNIVEAPFMFQERASTPTHIIICAGC